MTPTPMTDAHAPTVLVVDDDARNRQLTVLEVLRRMRAHHDPRVSPSSSVK
ncbi:MAG: hypothetical protein WCQ64_09015 [Acidobacteriota bacterium]